MHVLTEEGKKYLKEGLPEKRLIVFINKSGPVPFKGLDRKIENLGISIGWAKKKRWVKIENGIVKLTDSGRNAIKEKLPEENALELIDKGEEVDEKILNVLISRNLATEKKDGIGERAKRLIGKEVTNLAPELIKSGLWKKVKLKPYNVSVLGERI